MIVRDGGEGPPRLFVTTKSLERLRPGTIVTTRQSSFPLLYCVMLAIRVPQNPVFNAYTGDSIEIFINGLQRRSSRSGPDEAPGTTQASECFPYWDGRHHPVLRPGNTSKPPSRGRQGIHQYSKGDHCTGDRAAATSRPPSSCHILSVQLFQKEINARAEG